MTRPLSPRQRDVLRAIHEYLVEFGRVPSRREIMDYFGYGSTGYVQRLLQTLRKKGYVDWEPYTESLRLTGARLRVEFTSDEAGEKLRAALEEREE